MATRLCGIPGLKWQKTTLLEKNPTCTATQLSSKYVRSRYQVHAPYSGPIPNPTLTLTLTLTLPSVPNPRP